LPVNHPAEREPWGRHGQPLHGTSRTPTCLVSAEEAGDRLPVNRAPYCGRIR
jgi:hypothetical protein